MPNSETKRTGVSILDVEYLENNFKVKNAKAIGTVLRCRLDGLTLEKTGVIIGRTRERVRQMEALGCEYIRQTRK